MGSSSPFHHIVSRTPLQGLNDVEACQDYILHTTRILAAVGKFCTRYRETNFYVKLMHEQETER